MKKQSFTVDILPDRLHARARAGSLLADVLVSAGLPVSLYCHKKGLCGKCVVRVLGGPLPLLQPREKAVLESRGLGPDYRLACLYRVTGNLVVEVPPESRLEKIEVLETGPAAPVLLDPKVKKLALKLDKLGREDSASEVEALGLLMGTPDLSLSLAALRELGRLRDSARAEATVVFHGEREVLAVEPGDTTAEVYGLAVDIGTSTVVAELVDLATGRGAARASAMNSQVSYGADVVSRITFAFQNPEALRRLHNAAVRQINDLAAELSGRSGVPLSRVYEVVIAGNTAMSHFLADVTVDSLARSPFSSVFGGLGSLPASDIGLDLHPAARAYLVPNIRSFVGGDIAAGIAAAEMTRHPGSELFIDLGTNGEIVVKKGDRFTATSTAAGPAFEGMSISCGMLAVPGAVHSAEWAGGFRLHTIGEVAPRGVCGTGLIDILAIALEQGLVAAGGRIATSDRKLHLSDRLSLNQQDVREIQLAAAAVKTGVRLLLAESRLSPADLEAVYVAGAFGSSLDIRRSRAIGLLPDLPEEKIRFIGNSSLAGAKRLLLSGPERNAVESLVKRIGHVSLATRRDFQEEFIRSLEFGPLTGGTS